MWTIDPAAQLHAYDAADLSHQLYQASVDSFVKFSTPTIANGKVYVGTLNSLDVFGLKDQASGSVASVVNAAAFQPGPVAPGSLVSMFGVNLAPAAQAPSAPWPRSLQGSSVFVNGVASPLAYVSPSQINLQIPPETQSGPATINVVAGGRVLPPVGLTVQAIAPDLFVNAQNHAIAQNQDGTANGTNHPAPPATLLTVYISGQGVNPEVATAILGGRNVEVASAGLSPTMAGVFEVSIKIPSLQPGEYSLTVDIGGIASNAAVVSVGVN